MPGAAMTGCSSTTCCPCHIRGPRWTASVSMSTASRPRSGAGYCWRTRRPIWRSRKASSKRSSSSRRSPGGPAAGCCSMSTMSMSPRSITAAILAPISTPSRSTASRKSISPAIPPAPTATAHRSSTIPMTGRSRESVWDLYCKAIDRLGPVPTLIERDADIPVWVELHAEARRAHDCMAAASRGGRLAIAC